MVADEQGITWNYCIIDHGEWLGLHEVYYRGGEPAGYTEKPVVFACDAKNGAADLILALQIALNDVRKHPVLKASDIQADGIVA